MQLPQMTIDEPCYLMAQAGQLGISLQWSFNSQYQAEENYQQSEKFIINCQVNLIVPWPFPFVGWTTGLCGWTGLEATFVSTEPVSLDQVSRPEQTPSQMAQQYFLKYFSKTVSTNQQKWSALREQASQVWEACRADQRTDSHSTRSVYLPSSRKNSCPIGNYGAGISQGVFKNTQCKGN